MAWDRYPLLLREAARTIAVGAVTRYSGRRIGVANPTESSTKLNGSSIPTIRTWSGWLRAYAAEMRSRGLHIPFECITRADRLNAEAADLLAELGCFRLWIGSESGSQKILDAMERGVTVAQVQSAIQLCKSRGIQTGMFLMWGYEGEQLEDIEATITHVKTSDPDIFFTTVAYPIKGTPYYERNANSLVQLKPWNSSSDRELLLRGRRSPEFYGFADRLLQNEVQLARLQRAGTDEEAQKGLRQQVRTLRECLYSTSSEVSA
jgi:anaerobic magnesium-protoporphyrin IX monomethyl ester cyclase